MNLSKKIKQMLQEAELYRTQGLLSEALEQYKQVETIIRKNPNVKNQEALLTRISTRIRLLEKDVESLRSPRQAPRVSEEAQALIKEMFSFEDPNVKGSASLGGAISLAEFGQYEKAIEEFEALLDYDSLRLEAAKNVFKYGMRLASAEEMIRYYQQWMTDSRFTGEEIRALQETLQQMLDEAGIEEDVSQINPPEMVEPESEVDDEDILDISAIRFRLPKGSSKGQPVEIDVNFQHGKQLNLIIPKKEKGIIKGIDAGNKINGVVFYSPVAIFSGTVYVSAKKEIGSGPKRGDYSADLKILRIEAG